MTMSRFFLARRYACGLFVGSLLFGAGCAGHERTVTTAMVTAEECGPKIDAVKKSYEDRIAQAKAEAEVKAHTKHEETAAIREALNKQLKDYAGRQQVLITQLEDQTLLEIEGDVLFASEENALTAEGAALVRDIGAALSRFPEYLVRVEGHTDDRPIGPKLKAKFESNWELSAARASTVVRYLVYGLSFDPTRLSVVGYGKFRPLADNATEQGRAKNRRVEVAIFKAPLKREQVRGEHADSPR